MDNIKTFTHELLTFLEITKDINYQDIQKILIEKQNLTISVLIAKLNRLSFNKLKMLYNFLDLFIKSLNIKTDLSFTSKYKIIRDRYDFTEKGKPFSFYNDSSVYVNLNEIKKTTINKNSNLHLPKSYFYINIENINNDKKKLINDDIIEFYKILAIHILDNFSNKEIINKYTLEIIFEQLNLLSKWI